MSVAVMSPDDLIVLIRKAVREELIADRAVAVTHSPTEKLTPKQYAAELREAAEARGEKNPRGCGDDNIYRKVLTKKIPAKQTGRLWEILRADVCECTGCAAWRKANAR